LDLRRSESPPLTRIGIALRDRLDLRFPTRTKTVPRQTRGRTKSRGSDGKSRYRTAEKFRYTAADGLGNMENKIERRAQLPCLAHQLVVAQGGQIPNIWLTIARMCRTASTKLHEPASPLVANHGPRFGDTPKRFARLRLTANRTEPVIVCASRCVLFGRRRRALRSRRMKSNQPGRTFRFGEVPCSHFGHHRGDVNRAIISRMDLIDASAPYSALFGGISDGTRSRAIITAQAPVFRDFRCAALVRLLITTPP